MSGLNGINTADNAAAIKAKIYSGQLREQLQPMLNAMNFVDEIKDFPDGDSWEDVEMGNATVRDYTENSKLVYDGIEITTRQFVITDYISSAHKVSEKFLQDSYLSAQVMAKVPGLEARAIYSDLEQKILANQAGQKAGETNTLDNIRHRFVAGEGATNVHGTLRPEDFFYVTAGLSKHGYTATRIAIVPAWQEYKIPTNAEFMKSISYSPMHERIVTAGAVSGMKFAFNVAGFDVYTSNFTPVVTETLETREADAKVNATNAGVAMLFSNEAGRRPWRMAWRMMPKFEGKWDMDERCEKYATVARYGIGAGDKANLFCVLCADSPASKFA
jgi:hypothetical protein